MLVISQYYRVIIQDTMVISWLCVLGCIVDMCYVFLLCYGSAMYESVLCVTCV